MNATYTERLRIAWLLTWRGTLVNVALGGGVGFVIGFVFAFLGLREWVTLTATVVGFLLALFVGMPLIVKMMLGKHYHCFCLQVVRSEEMNRR